MDFRIERSRLIGPLQQVAKFAGSRALNMLDGVRIELSKAGLELAGGDSDRFLKLQLPNEQLEAHAFGSVVLSAKTLLDIVRKADDGRIRFTKLNGHYVSVTSDSSSFRLAGHPADDYPDFEVIGTKDGPIIELQAGELVRLIDQTAYAVSKREDTPVLTGVLVTALQGRISFAACDRHRLAIAEQEIGSDTALQAVVPGQTLSHLSGMLQSGPDKVTLTSTGQRIIITFGPYTLSSSTLQGSYPDVRKKITGQLTAMASVHTGRLIKAVERTMIIAAENKSYLMDISIAGGKLHLLSEGEAGQVEETVAILEQQGHDFEICCSGAYLLDALKAIASERTAVHYNPSMRMIILKPAGDQELPIQGLHLIMAAMKAGKTRAPGA